MKRTFVYLVTSYVVLILLTSCASEPPIKYMIQDNGSTSKDNLATLLNIHNRKITVPLIDGKAPPKNPKDFRFNGSHYYGNMWDCSFIMELLPGKHTITVEYEDSSTGRTLSGSTLIGFNAEAGKVYKIMYSVDHNTWKTWVEKVDGIPPSTGEPPQVIYY